MVQIQDRLTGQAHCLVLFGLEDVQQSLAEARGVFSLVGVSVLCFVVRVVDGSTFRKSSSAWRRASALADRVAWMRVLRAAASMVECEYWIPRLCVQTIVLCVNVTGAPSRISIANGQPGRLLSVMALKLAWVQGLAVAFFDHRKDSGAKPSNSTSCPTLPPATPGHTNKTGTVSEFCFVTRSLQS
jgi:hypothetical protein